MSSEFIARTFENTDHSGPLRFVWSHIRRHPVYGILMVLGSFVNAALASLTFIFMGRAVDAIIADDDLETVAWMGLGIITIQITRGVFQFMRNYSSEVFSQRIERDVRDELYVSLLGKSMTFHDMQPVGEIMARVTNDVRQVNFMMNPGLNLVIGSGMFVLLPALVSPTIHPALFLTPFVFILCYVYVQYRYTLTLYNVAQHVRRTFGRMNARLAESLDGIEVVKGSAQETREINEFNNSVDAVRDEYIRQGEHEARYFALLLLGLAIGFGFVHAVYLYRIGQIEAGDIVAYVGQIGLFGFPVFSSSFSLLQIASGWAGSERILAIINARTDLDQNVSGYSEPLTGEIRFENVSFAYQSGKEVLHNISFTIEAGQTVAIVGQTGSGKTTLTKLINRTYDVQKGRVLIDGVDVRDWNLARLRSQISIIEQEIFLFSRTIAENIAFGSHDATQEEIEQAAKDAQAHDFIMRFPEGYQTVIGQRGVTLSGGQRQRLAIARAFLTNPHLLILDDSTSAIDSATEDQIQKAIWKAAAGRTTILITHRLSQIRWADKIILIRKGQIAAQGTHDELLATSDLYRRIFVRNEETADVYGTR